MSNREMKAVKTSELIGAALDWAVAVAIGYEMRGGAGFNQEAWFDGYKFVSSTSKWQPSTDWSHGGSLLDQHCKGFGLIQDGKDSTWRAFGYSRHVFDSQRLQRMASGPSILVAACRAIVAANLGDSVQVPAELAGGSHG